MKPDIEIDATGLLSPLPVLKLKKRMAQVNDGAIIKILSDDPAAVLDIPYFCTENNHKFLASRVVSGEKTERRLREYYVKKK